MRMLTLWCLPDAIEAVELLVSELMTNAIRAADGVVSLSLLSDLDHLRVEVWDRSAAPPVLGRADDDAEGGRGLFLVAAVSADWGWFPEQGGKTVWALIKAR